MGPTADELDHYVMTLNNKFTQPNHFQNHLNWTVDNSGPPHALQWRAELKIAIPAREVIILSGLGTTKNAAKGEAARQALQNAIVRSFMSS